MRPAGHPPREMVTYRVGDLEITAPRDWTDLQRANAVCELQHGHELGALATLALLAACGKARAHHEYDLAAWLLEYGWRPGDL